MIHLECMFTFGTLWNQICCSWLNGKDLHESHTNSTQVLRKQTNHLNSHIHSKFMLL
ncbi:hypothetical protein Hanom_Chr11g01010691 [Helianthus anomalus]